MKIMKIKWNDKQIEIDMLPIIIWITASYVLKYNGIEHYILTAFLLALIVKGLGSGGDCS